MSRERAEPAGPAPLVVTALGLAPLTCAHPQSLRASLGTSGSGHFTDGHGKALPQPTQGAVDRCRLGRMIGIQHPPHFALGHIGLIGVATCLPAETLRKGLPSGAIGTGGTPTCGPSR